MLDRRRERLCELHAAIGDVCELFQEEASDPKAAELGGRFLNAFEKHRSGNSGDYVQVIQRMPETISRDGVRWLQHVVECFYVKRAGALLHHWVFSEITTLDRGRSMGTFICTDGIRGVANNIRWMP